MQIEDEQVQALHLGDIPTIPHDIRYWLGAAPGRICINRTNSELNDQRLGKAWLGKGKWRRLFEANGTYLISEFAWRCILRWGDPNLSFTSIKLRGLVGVATSSAQVFGIAA